MLDIFKKLERDPAKEEFYDSIAEPEQIDETLPETASRYYSEVNKDLNGEEAMPITLQSELDELNRVESDRMDQEHLEAAVDRDIRDVAQGAIDANKVHLNAIAEARRMVYNQDHLDNTAASRSAAIENEAKAEVEEKQNLNLNEHYSKILSDIHQKEAITEDNIVRLRGDAGLLDYVARWGTIFVPFEDSYTAHKAAAVSRGEEESFWKNSAKALKDVFTLNVGDPQKELKKRFAELEGNPDVSPEEFSKELSKFIAGLEEAGMNKVRIAEFLSESMDPETSWLPWVSAAGDTLSLVPIVGGVAKGAKAAAVGIKAGTSVGKLAAQGVKGATKIAVEEATPWPLVEAAGKIAYKGGTALVSPISRAKRAGRINRAANLLAEKNSNLTGVLDSNRAKEVVEEAVDSAVKPIANLDTSLTRTKEVHASNVQNAIDFQAAKHLSTEDHKAMNELLKAADEAADVSYANRLRSAAASLEDANNLRKLKMERWSDIVSQIENPAKLEDSLKETNGLSDILNIKEDLSKVDPDNIRQAPSGKLYATVRLRKEYDTVKAAEKDIKKLRINGKGVEGSAVVVPTSNRFAVDFTVKADKGWGTLQYNATGKGAPSKTRAFLSSIFTHSSMPPFLKDLNALRVLDATALQSTGHNLIQTYKSLSKEDKELFDAIAELSLEEEVWYSKEYLLARGLSDKLANAYEDYHLFSDLNYIAMNDARRAAMVEMGLKSIKFGKEDMGYGAVFKGEAGKDLISGHFKKVLFGTTDKAAAKDIDKIDEGVKSAYRKMIDQGQYHVVKKWEMNKSSSDAGVYLYVLPSNQIIENRLPHFVMNYIAGPRRFFDRSAGFVKQLNLSKGDTGRIQITGAKTLMTDPDIAGLSRTTEALEKLRLAAAEGKDVDVLTKLIHDGDLVNAPFKSGEEFRTWAAGVGLDIEHPENVLEVVHNGSMLSSYQRLAKQDNIEDMVGEAEMLGLMNQSAYQGMDKASRIAKSRRSGRDILDFNWDVAQTVDFEKSISYMVKDMVNNGTMRHFADFYAEAFVKTYGSVLRDADDMSLTHALMYAPIDHSKPLADNAEAARRNYLAMRGIPTDFDQTVAKTFTHAFEALGMKAEDLLHLSNQTAHGIRTKAHEFWAMDPLKFLRAVAAHKFLGCANLSQLWKQASTTVYVASMAGLDNALKAFRYAPSMSAALLKSDSSVTKALEQLATKFGDAPSEVQFMYKNLVKLGAQQHGLAGGFIEAGQTTSSKLAKLSFAPFNMGEMFNRTMAYLAALSKNGYSNKALTSATDIARIKKEADQLFFNMDAAGLSRLQAGTLGKTALQMVGYQMKAFETLFFEDITATQRFWLATTMGALTGMEGMIGTKAWMFVSNIFSDGNDPEIPEEEGRFFQKLISEGIPNAVLDQMGIPVDLGSAFAFNFVENMNPSLFSFLQELPSVTAANQTINGIFNACKTTWSFLKEGASLESFRDYLTVAARHQEFPASFNRIWLASEILRTGLKYNSRGLLTERDQSLMDSVIYAIGINSQTSRDVYREYLKNGKEAERMKAAEKNLQPLFMQYLRNHDETTRKILVQTLDALDFTSKQKRTVLSRLYGKVGSLTVSEQLKYSELTK